MDASDGESQTSLFIPNIDEARAGALSLYPDCFKMYTRFLRRFKPFSSEQFVELTDSPTEKLTDMGWEIYPEGLYRALMLITRYTSKPINITENGIADDSDAKRAKFIEDHLLVWGRMSIVDTKAFMLLLTHCSISGRMPPAINSPVRPVISAGYRRFQYTP